MIWLDLSQSSQLIHPHHPQIKYTQNNNNKIKKTNTKKRERINDTTFFTHNYKKRIKQNIKNKTKIRIKV